MGVTSEGYSARVALPSWQRHLREVLTREMVADLVTVAGGLAVAATGVFAGWANLVWRLGIGDRMPQVWGVAAVAGVLFVALRRYARAGERPLRDARAHLLADLRVVFALLVLFLAVVYLTRSNDAFARGWIVGWVVLAVGALFLLRLAVAKLVIPRLRDLLAHRVVVAGPPAGVVALQRQLREGAPEGMRLVGVAAAEDPAEVATEVARRLEREPVDEVILAVPVTDGDAVYRLCDALVAVPADISVWLGEGAARLARLGPFELDALPRQILLRRPIRHWGRIAKGVMDRVGAAVLLVLLSPLFLLIAVAIKLDSPGPVFFRQLRYGYGRRPFVMWKFRSMYHECDDPRGPYRQATRNDPRVTRVGRWLRRTSLDELPQLINVLRGEMSLVGPRPHPTRMDDELGRLVELYAGRNRVKPGLTGWAQINGCRGETDRPEKLRRRIEYDLEYMKNWSLALDLWILWLTPWKGLASPAAY